MNARTSVGTPEKVPDVVSNGLEPNKLLASASKMADGTNLQASSRPIGPCLTAIVPEMSERRTFADDAQAGNLHNLSCTQPSVRFPTGNGVLALENMQGNMHGRIKLNNFDLNNVYNDSQDGIENLERSYAPVDPGTSPPDCTLLVQQDSYKSSPPQTSANSDSTSARSLSTSSGEAQVYFVVFSYLFLFTVMVILLNSCGLGDRDPELHNPPDYVPIWSGTGNEFIKLGSNC